MNNIKLFMSIAAMLLFCIAPLQNHAQITAQNTSQKETLAISTVKATPELENKIKSLGKNSELKQLTQSLEQMFADRISANNKFQIVSRNDSDLNEIISEQTFGDSGLVNPQTSARLGQIKGAKYILISTLDDFQDRTRILKIDNERKLSIRSLRVSLITKLYDSTTSALLDSATQTFTNEMRRNINPTVLSDEGPNTDQIFADASRKIADKIAADITNAIFPAKIVGCTFPLITINRGEGTGIKSGQTWVVYAIGEEMIDPDTGESLGTEEIPICKAKVLTVKTKTTTLQIVGDDMGVEKGMIVRPEQGNEFGKE